MTESIINKIKELGGNTDAVSIDKNFAENWRSIRFEHHLYDRDWDVYGIDDYYEKYKTQYNNDQEGFYKNLLEHYFSGHELPYGQYFLRNWFFTPFKKGTEDYKELDGLIDEHEVKEIVEGSEMEFICLFYFYGYFSGD
ncbi:hypothetical protein [Chryseobacterium sp.]|jgi:hypothetical protein|uniref:hypothetical protein n=1 Tax=Chryseobacterium sp. TaxID=1871047 RepID=UPI00283D186A|nr:hypothetical protein [Chryseobacterium sp.]MDR3022756.1 hypothetical protein [Chryseobacterium sp.]